MSAIRIETLTDPADRLAALDNLARLRIAIFRHWPYLYDGSLDYERRYLGHFIEGPGATLIVARNGDEIVGVATASPMSGQHGAFRSPLEALGHDVSQLFYFGESVLRPAYHGQGIGHAFFDAREAAARTAGAQAACFCAVVRPADHPLKPAHARDLTSFWRKRGYAPLDGVVAHYDWKDIDQPEESSHPMHYWHRTL